MNRFLLSRVLFGRKFLATRTPALLFLISSIFFSEARGQEKCNACSVPSFAALTVYHTWQTGPGMGLGIEAGKWKKDAGRFSYFLGTEMLWSNRSEKNGKLPGGTNSLFISFYWKGQYKMAERFYFIAQPEIVNLSSFDMRTGIRFVLPVTKIIGVGLEPGYALVKKQWSLNTNVHFALR
jgi:hypothetical protein